MERRFVLRCRGHRRGAAFSSPACSLASAKPRYFPGNSKAVGYWFPDRERSLATAFFDSAAKLGPAIGVPFIGLLLLHFGWRWSFAATGFISLLYFALFYVLYRNPSEDTKLSDAEREFIVRRVARNPKVSRQRWQRCAAVPIS